MQDERGGMTVTVFIDFVSDREHVSIPFALKSGRDDNFLQFGYERVATFCRISVYALSQYVSRCNQQTIAAKKADDTGISRRVPSPHGVDLYAVSIARRTPGQNQRRIQG